MNQTLTSDTPELAVEPSRVLANDVRAPRTTEHEIASLTAIRGIGSSWVVLAHLSPVLFAVLPEVSFVRPLVGAGEFVVPLFFILSGYVLGLRYLTRLGSPTAGTVRRFWGLRLGRVYPVHLFTLALITLGSLTRHGWPTDEAHTIGRFIANCLVIHAWDYNFRLSWNLPSWSISSECFAYLIFPLVAVVLARASRRQAALLVAVTWASSAGIYAFIEHLPFKGLAVVVPTFIGGVGIAIVCPPSGSMIRLQPWATLSMLAALVLPFVVGSGPLQGALYFVFFFTVVGILGVTGNRATGFWQSRPLVYLGEISYSLYMTHFIAITQMARFFPFDAMKGQPLALRIVTMLGCLVVILGTAVAVYYTVERPARILVRSRLSTRAPSLASA